MRNKQELLHEYYPQDILYRRAKLVKIIQKARTVQEYKKSKIFDEFLNGKAFNTVEYKVWLYKLENFKVSVELLAIGLTVI